MKPIGLFVQSLRDRNFTIYLRDDKIMINPASKLHSSEVDYIREHREELITYLECPVTYELARYAVNHPLDFAENEQPDPAVILTAPDWPVMVFSKSFVDAVCEWNRNVDERRKQAELRDQHKAELKRKKIKKHEATIMDLPDTSASDL